MKIIEKYQQLIEKVSSENKVHAILSELEHQSTIEEVEEFAEWIGLNSNHSKWKEQEDSWFISLQSKFALMEPNPRRDWARVWSRNSFHYFSSKSDTSRMLLICFADRFGWMLLTTWQFLSFLPTRVTDVLIVQSRKDYQEKDFVRFKSIWLEIQPTVTEITNARKIETIKVLGVSGGCVGAALYASSNKVQGLTLVGVPTLDETAFHKLDLDATKMLKSRSFTKSMRVKYITGLRDITAMSQIIRFIRLFPRRSIRIVPNIGHNVFVEMFNRKQLSKALKWTI